MRLLTLTLLSSQPVLDFCRGRDAGCPAPPAQIRTGRIAAYGSYLGYLASKRRLGWGVEDFGTRNPLIDQRPEPLPCHPAALAPPPQRAVPAPDYLGPKAVQTIHVAGHCMIVEVALYD